MSTPTVPQRVCVFELDLTCGHCVTVRLDGWYPVRVACCDRLGGTWINNDTYQPFASPVEFARCLQERYEQRPADAPWEPVRILQRRARRDDPVVAVHTWQQSSSGRFPDRVGAPIPPRRRTGSP